MKLFLRFVNSHIQQLFMDTIQITQNDDLLLEYSLTDKCKAISISIISLHSKIEVMQNKALTMVKFINS